ncbi:uncharacterized protein LOC134243391 [Saccostrea cucullata]|uniref:uncharacterized protein LOC134243391 n=1 Tax=Saccostrea cuccullata TaxID=36930 RepID=UPI002ED58675
MGLLLSYFCLENVALKRPTWQQHPLPNDAYGSDNAVDGEYSDRSTTGDQCVLSDNFQTTATWWVDLGRVYSISHINIMYKTDNLPRPSPFVGRLAGFSLYVSNTSCKDDGHLCFHEIQNKEGTPSEDQRINCPVHGRFVIFYNERVPGVEYPYYYSPYAYNDLCEVQVHGCLIRAFYGEDCNRSCPYTCQNHLCHIHTGECFSCLPGYQGPRCEQRVIFPNNTDMNTRIIINSVITLSIVLIGAAIIYLIWRKK